MNEGIKVNSHGTNENLCKVNKFAKYKYNWNDNGASAFDTKHLEIVKGILVMLKVQPEVFPTADSKYKFIIYECANSLSPCPSPYPMQYIAMIPYVNAAPEPIAISESIFGAP